MIRTINVNQRVIKFWKVIYLAGDGLVHLCQRA